MHTAYVCTVYWLVRMVISSPVRTMYTLKFSGTHPFFQSYEYPDKTDRESFYRNTKIAQICFPVWCETSCLVKMTDQSQNVCREGEPGFDFSIF